MSKAKKVHFISGLPRSGSTLLANILTQNPEFSVTGTSGILGIIKGIRDGWQQNSVLMASSNDEQKIDTMKGAFYGYMERYDAPVVFDKSRAWTGYVELAELLTGDVKIIVTVRDLTDILASFEKLFRKQAGKNVFPQEREFPTQWVNIEGRAEVMTMVGQPVGSAFAWFRDALNRKHGDKIHIVEYSDLTNSPKETLDKIYDFLGYEKFEHDFDNVEQTIFENDLFHGMGEGLHSIKPKVEPQISDAKKILGENLWKKYHGQEFWR